MVINHFYFLQTSVFHLKTACIRIILWLFCGFLTTSYQLVMWLLNYAKKKPMYVFYLFLFKIIYTFPSITKLFKKSLKIPKG
jgi:hypothetical protein